MTTNIPPKTFRLVPRIPAIPAVDIAFLLVFLYLMVVSGSLVTRSLLLLAFALQVAARFLQKGRVTLNPPGLQVVGLRSARIAYSTITGIEGPISDPRTGASELILRTSHPVWVLSWIVIPLPLRSRQLKLLLRPEDAAELKASLDGLVKNATG